MSPINIFLFIFLTFLLFNYVDNTCIVEGKSCINDEQQGNLCCQKPKKLNCVEDLKTKNYKCSETKCTYNGKCGKNGGSCCYGSKCKNGKCQTCAGGASSCSTYPCCVGTCGKEGYCP